jgi:hypothetical protein
MNPKKILVVSGFFYPEITPRAFRTTELVKELSRRGNDVYLYIPFKGNNYDEFSKEYNVKIYDIGNNPLSEIIIPNRGIINIINRILRRILLILFEYPDIGLSYKVYKSLKKLNGFDLLISIAYPYPIHWGVALVKSFNNNISKKWIADCGDPYYFDPTEIYKKLFYFKYIEKWFFRKVDFISLPKIQMKKNYFEEFHDKIVEIPQGFSFDSIRLSKYEKNSVIKFAFAGTFYPKSRDPRKLIEFLLSLNSDFKFYIFTNSFELVNDDIIRKDKRIIFKEFIPRDQLIFELSKMDFLVNFNYDPINQSPSKLIDYSLTQRPILNVQQEIDEKIILEFLEYNFSNSFVIDDINKYDIKNIANKFIVLIDAK